MNTATAKDGAKPNIRKIIITLDAAGKPFVAQEDEEACGFDAGEAEAGGCGEAVLQAFHILNNWNAPIRRKRAIFSRAPA